MEKNIKLQELLLIVILLITLSDLQVLINLIEFINNKIKLFCSI